MLVQLHWQNRADYRETEFVAQGEFTDPESFREWSADVIKRRGNEIPDGWCPMMCTEDSEYFVWANPQNPKEVGRATSRV
jgi:hypothetical protein